MDSERECHPCLSPPSCRRQHHSLLYATFFFFFFFFFFIDCFFSLVVHVVALSGNAQTVGEIQYETDRSRFLGRGRSIRNPAVMDPDAKLSGRVG